MDKKLTDFEGLSMTHLQTASYRGTALDFSEKGVSNAMLTLPKRDIQSVCQLMRVLMDTIAVKGRLQDLHLDTDGGNELTYLQDGVEGYKRNFRSLPWHRLRIASRWLKNNPSRVTYFLSLKQRQFTSCAIK